MTKKATKPSDYQHMMAWGRKLGSGISYIVHAQERAFNAGAPIDAIYERYANDGSGPTGVWATAGECSQPVRDEIAAAVASYNQPAP